MLIEYAKYGDLFGFLKHMKNFSHKKITKFYYKIIQAVNYLHFNKLVHRDIKPENIMITDNFRPKLGDFGTSGAYREISDTFCGTYEYMAPEIYLRCKQTEKIDVWGLGILLYEIIHHKTPFKNETLQSIKSILDKKKIFFKPGINPLVIDFIYDVLQFDPLKRPTCDEMLDHKLFNNIKK